MIGFVFLEKEQFEAKSAELFDLLYANMEPIVPGEFVFEEWKAAVGGGMKSPKRQIVLINDGENLAGFFQYYVNDTTFMMEEIQIKPEYQQKYGIFRKLYGWLIPQFEKHPPFVEAYNHPRNQKSHGILNRMGLALVDEENGFRHYKGTFETLLNWLTKGE